MVRNDSLQRPGILAHSSVGMSWGRLIFLFAAFFLLFLALIGCGGMGKVGVTIVTPVNTSVDPGDSINLSVDVSNDSSDEGVKWTMSCSANACGAFSNNTKTSVTYTAPQTVSAQLTVTITATSIAQTSSTGTLALTVVVNPSITTPSGALSGGMVGASYSVTLAASGGIMPYTWSISQGTLPAGLTLNTSTGAITGVPTASGTSSFTATLTDSGSPALTATINLSIAIATAPAVTFTTTSLSSGTVGTAYAATVVATGGAGTLTYKVTTGSLPAGLTMSSAGTISGTPTASGTSSFTVTASDAYGDSATVNLSITIAAAPAITFTTKTLPSGTVGSAYTGTVVATGGAGTLTYKLTTGSLPAGLTMSSAGAISGTPSTAGTSSFTVTASDAYGDSASAALSISINATSLNVSTTSLPAGVVNVAYSQTLTASGGSGTGYTWSISSGSLPAGLSLAAGTGVISGTPTTAGTSNFTVKVTDSASNTATASLSITINSATLTITTSSLSSGTVNTAYSQTLSATGGVTPYTWSISSGSLPAGLSLAASTGVISGTPTTAGTSTFTIEVTDSASNTATASLSITINAVTLTVTTLSLQSGTVGLTYSATLTADGGTSPYTWSLSSGSLPAGLSLDTSTGVISGTPTTAGSSAFVVKVADSASNTAIANLSIKIYSSLSITSSGLPNGQTGVAYSATLEAAGGTSPYTWTLVSGSLPSGFSLASSGTISGTASCTCTNGQAFVFQVKVTDSESTPASVTASFSITINAINLEIETNNPPNGVVGTAYSTILDAVNGTTPYTWSIASGSLPAGLTLASDGDITGTPSTTGTSFFVVQVEDAASNTASRQLNITIYPSALQIDNTTVQPGNLGIAYSQPINVSGGTSPYTWSISSGSLPAGLSLGASTGKITGVPSTAGSSTFTVEVTDSASATATQSYTLTVYNEVACPSGSESELNGTYVMMLSGFNGVGLGTPVATIASFSANGAGGITGGETDFNSGSGSTNTPISVGSYYTVGSGGRGCIVVDTANGTNTCAFALGGVTSGVATRGRIIEFDDQTGSGQRQSGVLLQQTPADFAFNKLSSNFAFGLSGDDSSIAHFAFGGSLTNSTSGSFSAIYGDSNDNGTVNSAMSGGSGGFDAAADVNGRTTASIAIGSATYNYVAYIVNANEVLLVSSDPIDTNPIASGMMLATSSSFTSASISGNYIFAINGSDATNNGYGWSGIGILNSNGSSAWSGTVYEYELNGSGNSQGAPNALSGTYAVGAASGRVSLTTGPVIYLTNNSTGVTGFLIDSNSGSGADAFEGTMQVQPSATYGSSSVSGNYLNSIAAMSSNTMGTVVGTAIGNAGVATITEDGATIQEGLVSGFVETGSFTINSNGTGTSGSGNNTLLLTNGTTVYLMDTTGQAVVVEFDQQ